MGSWGYQPRQSDNAESALAPLDRALEREAYALFGLDVATIERRDRRARRAAARARKPSRTLKGRSASVRRYWAGFTPANDHRATLQVARGAAEKKGAAARAWALENRWARVGVLQILLDRGMSVPLAVVEQALIDLGSIIDEPNWKPTHRAARRMSVLLRALLAHRYNRHAKWPSDDVMPWRGWPRVERKRQRRQRVIYRK